MALFYLFVAVWGLIGLLLFLTAEDVIYKESFTWDTSDGLKSNYATLYKYKNIPAYRISYTITTSLIPHPNKHKSYPEFLKRVKEIKNKKPY